MARRKTAASQANSTAPQIVARDVVKTYRLGGSTIGALQGVSVESSAASILPSPAHPAPANRPL